MRSVPAAAFRGLASGTNPSSINPLLYAANLFLFISTSPLNSIVSIPYFENAALNGKERICFILGVISSPTSPSPLVMPVSKWSFS